MKRIKRAIALLLSAAMCFSVCPVSAFASIDSTEATSEESRDNYPEQDAIESYVVPVADEVESEISATEEPTVAEVEILASGTCGTNLAWSLDTAGKLTISGTGKMQDYSNGTYTPWYAYRDNVISVVVEEGVTSIGRLAFYVYFTNLKEVSLPETLTTIGNSAFRGCTALTQINIPESVTSLGIYAFYQCTSLTEIKLPEGLTSIGNYAFYQCTSLTSVKLPENLTSIGDYAFRLCTGLTEITLPDSLTTLGLGAFYDCTGLTKIELSESLTTIGSYAFFRCTGMTGTLVIPDQVTTIGSSAFQNCSGLTGLELGSSVETIGACAFQNCTGISGALVIPDSVKTIGYQAFSNMKLITSISCGAGLQSLGREYYNTPFYQCSGVKQITFAGTTAPTIYGNLFYSMSALESVTAPVEGYGSFAAALGQNLPSRLRLQCADNQDEMVIVDNVLVAYLGDGKTVEIPDTVTAIGNGAFMNCTALTAVAVPDTVTAIGSYAFTNCTSLKDINLPAGLTAIGKYAFYGCTAMTTELNLTDALTELGEYAFYNCKNITGSVYLSDHITQVETHVFYGCTGLNGTLRLPANLTVVNSYAFCNCANLTGSLELPETLTRIWNYAFYGCKSLTGDLKLPNSLTILDSDAFNGCSGFNGTLTLSESLTTINARAFTNCSGIVGELVIPESITHLYGSAFAGMSGLTSVVIGSNVVSVYYGPFTNCSGLKTITFKGLTVPTITQDPLRGMTSLEKIYVPAGPFADYAAAFKTYLPAGARLVSRDLEGDFLIEDGILLSYQGEGGEVVIPDTVTSIADYAFNGCDEMTKVTIPDTVTSIGAYAFRNCTGLTEFNLPDSIQTISSYLFYGCSGLTGTLVIPDNITAIEPYAFSGCSGLTGVDLGSVTTIGDSAFSGCTGLTSINTGSAVTIGTYAFSGCTGLIEAVIGDSVTTIGNSAFSGCTALTTLHLGSRVQTIGNYAFSNCGKLAAVDLGDSVTSVGNYAFQNCKGIKSLDLGSSVTSIGQHAFRYCSGMTGDLVLPDSLTTLGGDAFYQCLGLDGTLTLSKGLTDIPSGAFYGCSKISGELVIPDNVQTIGDYAFNNLSSLTSIVFGSGVTRIGSSTTYSYTPFYYCSGVTSVTFTGETPPSIPGNIFTSMAKLETVYVPLASFAAYSEVLTRYLPAKASLEAVGAESDFLVEDGVLVGYLGTDTEVTIPEQVTAIGPGVFKNNTTLTSVVIPDTVTSIGDYAFSGCSALVSANLPAALTSIGSHAFYNCKKWTGALTLPEGLEEIPAYAFYNCTQLTGELVIPDSVKTIDDYAFYGMRSITSIHFGSGVTTIGTNTASVYNPFYYCSGVKQITFNAETVPVFNGNMFTSMSGLTDVYIPADTYTEYAEAIRAYLPAGARIRYQGQTEDFLIEDGVLIAYLGDETAVQIPEGVTAIGDAAFLNNTTLTGVEIPDTVTAIGAYAFKGCSALSGTLILPENVTDIGDYAFRDCKSLTGDLIIPDSVTTLGTGAFRGCTGFNGTLKLSSGLTVLNKYTFYECRNIVGEVVVPDSVTKIDDYAFQYMTSMTSFVIGSGVTVIGSTQKNSYSILLYCSNLERITFTGSLPTLNGNMFGNLSKLEMVHVPKAEFKEYLDRIDSLLPSSARVLSTEMEEEFLIEDGVLLSYQGMGGEVVIPEGVTAIGRYAFHGCAEMTKVTIPEGVTAIDEYAFRGCTGLTQIDLPDSLTEIGGYAFSECKALGGVLMIPDKVETIGAYAFQKCTALAGLDLGSGVESIDGYAFYHCTGLTGDLVLPDSLKTLGSNAFYDCTKLKGTLKLSENLTAIPGYTFYGAKFTGELVIPDSVTTIGDQAFCAMPGLESIVIGAGVTQLGTSTSYNYTPFYGCSGVKTVMFMGAQVPTIPGNIFYSMSALETVYVMEESYDAYVEKLSPWLGESVEISTDFVTAKITNLAADRVYSQTIALSWNPHTSDSVVGYTVSCDGEVIGTTTECWYAVRELEPNTSYTYTVQGYTEDGRTTGVSQVTAATVLPEIKDIRTVSSANKINEISNTISIYVTDSGNLLPLEKENTVCALYCGDVLLGEATLDPALGTTNTAVYTFDWDMTGWEDGEHEIRVCLTDIDGASVEYSETLIIDRGIPAQIVGVTAIGDVNVLHINWAVAVETDTNIYRIYRRTETDEDYRLIAQINDRNTLSYTDKNIKNDRVYYYYVVGVNELNQEGVPSLVVAATLAPDTQAPVVTKLTPANGTYLKNTVTLRVTAEDDIAVVRGELHYSMDDGETWTLLDELSAGAFYTSFDTTALDDGVIRIRAIAYDLAGNASTPLEYIYAIDNHGPEKVQGLRYESTNISITLRWDNVSDADIHYYRVEQKNEDGTYNTVGNVYDTLGMNIYDLTPGTEYTYRVVGYDQQGNRGTPSEDIVTATVNDTTAPVVTRIRPTAGYYADVIPLVITATDEYMVGSITVQVSTNLLNWQDVYTQRYVGVSESQTLSYNLVLSNFAEGAIYVRAIAKDGGGNTSDTSVNAPYVQYVIDRTAPAAPQDVKAIGQCGYIEISWAQGSETDLNGYALYRAEQADGEYTLLAEGLTTINYYDRDVVEDVVYYYQVAVSDKAGNQSEYSEPVFAEVGEDTEAPVIVTIYPASDSLMGAGNNAVSVTATDNHMLQSLLIEYSADGSAYTTMYDLADISDYGQYADATVPVSEFADGDVVYLRVSATDQTGNVSEYFYATYTIDAVAPVVESAEAAYNSDDETVRISWTGTQEADLYGYRIYRVVEDAATLVGFCPAVAGQSAYAYIDSNLPVEKTTCTYKVEAVDNCGNTSALLTDGVEIPDRQFPRAIMYCDNTMEVNVEYVFDASASTDNDTIVSYAFDFGDGTTSTEPTVIHTYEATGEYTVTLTVEDNDGHVTTVSKTITVVERSAIGTVKIQIVDENGKAVPNAPVYFDLGEETQTMKTTDSTGCAIFTSTAGVHAVGCVIANNEWLPAKKDVIILAGAQTTVSMTLVHQAMIEGVFEVNRMTFAEIEAAGIDVSKPENQHIVSVDVKLTYGSTEQEASFIFNMVTKEAIGDVTYDSDSDGCVDREIVPVVLAEEAIAYLDLPIGASLLKEFFDVRLNIINNASSEFSMLDNVITLNVPEGLSIVDAAGTESNATVEIDEIPGQTSTTISWILRGDQEGEYSLSADYSGQLSRFDEPIHTKFVSKEPIKVYGLSAVKLIAEVNSSVNYDAFYFNLALENISDIDVNLPSIEIENHVLTSYLSRVTEIFDENGVQTEVSDPTVSKPTVRHLNTILSNSSGYSQYIGTETTVQTLAAGEKLTNQYAAYNVTGYDNLMLLQQAIYEIVESYGIQFELIKTDMDLFSTDHAADKLADIAANADKQAQYDEILDCSRYFYVLESLDRQTNIFIREGDALYTTMKKYMAIDTSYDAEATAELTRAIVAQLMVDESMQQAIETAVDSKYLEVTTGLLGKIGTLLSGDDLTAWNSYLETDGRIRTLADKLEIFGLARFADYLIDDLTAAGVSDAGSALIRSYYDGGDMAAALSEAVGGVCTLVSQAVEKLDAVSVTWSDSAEIVTDLIRVAAAQQEMNLLLDMLSGHTDEGGAIHTELLAICNGLGDIETQLADKFAESLNVSLAEETNTTAAIIGCLDSVYGAGSGTSYTLIKLAFGSVDEVLTWDGITTDRHVLSVCTEISLALRQAVEQYGLNFETDEQAVYTLTALKYLIKMRLIGEQCFVTAMSHLSESDQEEALAWINETKSTDYESLPGYLDALQVRLLTYRDNIFASYYTNLEIPAAPKVTINYLTGTTVETFSSDYEYSFEGSVWYACNGGTISFAPAAVNQYLWVRVKGTDSSLAGNITKVVIPAMSRITGDITMTYVEDGYQISGLRAGTYQYAFTNEKTAVTMTNSITVTDGEIIKILADEGWTYLALGTAATETAFASQIRYVVAEKPWVLDTDTYVVTGMEEMTTALQVVNYYGAKGYTVTVVAADGTTTEAVGTGCVVNLDGESYSAVVSGDVNGDAVIDLNDLSIILNYINSDEELAGVYFQAGRVCENEDIDLFDLWSELTYIKSSSFTE